MGDAVRIRAAVAADLRVIAGIEQSAALSPWSLSQFLESRLRDRDACLVLENAASEILGFLVYQQVHDEATLLNIAVRPDCQGEGHGARLLAALLNALGRTAARRLLLEVRCGNEAAIGLYRRFGFVDKGVRPDYYPTPVGREDALLMARHLEDIA
jgi:ribosomal-protein-alanine N-acetyltransferase